MSIVTMILYLIAAYLLIGTIIASILKLLSKDDEFTEIEHVIIVLTWPWMVLIFLSISKDWVVGRSRDLKIKLSRKPKDKIKERVSFNLWLEKLHENVEEMKPKMTKYQYETAIFCLEEIEKEYRLQQGVELAFEEESE